MVSTMNVVFLPLARPTFDVETANGYREQSVQLLQGLASRVEAPESLLMSPEDTAAYLRGVLESGLRLDAVIVQCTTFVDARFIMEVMDATDAPLLLWGVREPRVGGTRLSLNSLTGVNNFSNSIVARRRKFAFLFGNPNEQALGLELARQLRVLEVLRDLRSLKIGMLGQHPDGFFFSGADRDMLRKVGPEIVELDLKETFAKAETIGDEEVAAALRELEGKVRGLDGTTELGLGKFARMQAALLREVKERGIGMVAVRCWPEFFNDYGAAACSTVSSFIESGIMASCEADIHGVITMYIQHRLAASAPYLGDLVHIDESKNSGVFWHCGAGAFSLARPDTGAAAGVHPNRKLGFTLEFGLKAGGVTINRLGPDPLRPGEYRMLSMRGEALDEPQAFWGTSVEVGFGQPVRPLLKQLMQHGFEPHYSIIYQDITEEIGMLCEWLDVHPVLL